MYTPSFSYSQLLQHWPQQVEEKKSSYHFFSERHLQAMWLEQRYFRPLTTTSGESVEVISPGAWNGEAGPDFRFAHVKIGGREVKGDIELHLSQEGWTHHKHHIDQRYDQVVLHVCLWLPQNVVPSYTSAGNEIIQAFMEPALTIPLARITRLLDLDLYPYRKFVGSGKCAQTLFCQLPEDNIRTLLHSAAQWRFREKRNYLNGHVEDKSLRFPAGMAMALGYKHYAQLFLQLFLWLQTQPKQSIDERIVLVLGLCGFFQPAFETRWSDSKMYQRYRDHWSDMNDETWPRFALQVQACRPYNHPVRRLVALAFLSLDESLGQLLAQMVAVWKACWIDCKKNREYRQLARALTTLFPVYQHDYWNNYFLFESQPADQSLTLMGPDLLSVMLINILIPLLQESISNPLEEQALLHFINALTTPSSGKRRYLVHRFFGDLPRGEALRSSLMEQGAFQLHRDFCVHYEASCEGCPFVERVKSHATFSLIEAY